MVWMWDWLKKRNPKTVLTILLVLSNFLFLLMVWVAYHATQKSVTVSAVAATGFAALILNILTLIGNHWDSYFMITLFFWITLAHILVNLVISIKFALLFIALFWQIMCAIIARIQLRRLKENKMSIERNRRYSSGEDVLSKNERLTKMESMSGLK